MHPIKNIVILGAGALGSYFVAQFMDVDHFSTTIIARGTRYERLKANGLEINGKSYAVPVLQPDEATIPADLIIVALKHHHLNAALPDLRNFVDPHTTIISVMNGLDSENIIGEMYGMDKLLYAISVGIDAVRKGHCITYTKPGKHYFGHADNTHISPQVQRVQDAFDQASISYETPSDMLRVLWWKFMVNVGMNQASAVTRAPYGVFQTTPAAQALMEDLMHEVIMLAKHAGVNLVEQDIADWYTFLNSLSPHGKTSMLQDIEAGRKTEVEVFGGKVVALGKAYNVPTPVNETIFRIIQILESKD